MCIDNWISRMNFVIWHFGQVVTVAPLKAVYQLLLIKKKQRIQAAFYYQKKKKTMSEQVRGRLLTPVLFATIAT